jgi:hypothetical protein
MKKQPTRNTAVRYVLPEDHTDQRMHIVIMSFVILAAAISLAWFGLTIIGAL